MLEAVRTGQQERQLLLVLFETPLLLLNGCILYMLLLLFIGHVFSNFILSARIFKMLIIYLYQKYTLIINIFLYFIYLYILYKCVLYLYIPIFIYIFVYKYIY